MHTLRTVFGYVVLVGTVALGASVGCGASGSTAYQTTDTKDAGKAKKDTGTSEAPCQAETFRDCRCDGGGSGTEACEKDGKWGTCECTKPLGMDASTAKPSCGDGTCNGKETCVTCPDDCGACPACELAPTCTGASSVPTDATALPSFNNGTQSIYSSGVDAGAGGSANCSDPLLKMRVSDIQIHQNGASGGVEMFCVVQADDGQSSELMVTPDYMNLNDNNPPLILSPSTGTFWGEAVNGVKLSQFNITITYQCYMVLQPDAFQNALNAIAGVAGAAAAIPGNPYGWAFGLGGAAAAAAAAATAAGSGASVLLSVQQTIDSNSLLSLTNGRTWVIEQTGSTKLDGDCGFFGGCTWDWELDVEAWGCAAPKGETPK